MVLKVEQERVHALLKDTITLLCRNGLSFKSQFSVEALIGITLDKEDIFLININEIIKSEANKLDEFSRDTIASDEGATSHSHNDSDDETTNRKRRKRKRKLQVKTETLSNENETDGDDGVDGVYFEEHSETEKDNKPVPGVGEMSSSTIDPRIEGHTQIKPYRQEASNVGGSHVKHSRRDNKTSSEGEAHAKNDTYINPLEDIIIIKEEVNDWPQLCQDNTFPTNTFPITSDANTSKSSLSRDQSFMSASSTFPSSQDPGFDQIDWSQSMSSEAQQYQAANSMACTDPSQQLTDFLHGTVLHRRNTRRNGAAKIGNLTAIHNRYEQLKTLLHDPSQPENTIQAVCRKTGIGVQTVRDTRGLAEINLVKPEAYGRLLEKITEDQIAGDKITLKMAENRARRLLRQYHKDVMIARKHGILLPFKDYY